MPSRAFYDTKNRLATGRLSGSLRDTFRRKPKVRLGTVLSAGRVQVENQEYEFHNASGVEVTPGQTLQVVNVGRPSDARYAPADGVGVVSVGGGGGSTSVALTEHSHEHSTQGGVLATYARTAHVLASHSDVSAAAPADGNVLAWNAVGGEWAAAALSADWADITSIPTTFAPSAHALGFHSDVNVPTPGDGQALVWDNTAGKWIPGDILATGVAWADVTGKPTTFAYTDAANVFTATQTVGSDTAASALAINGPASSGRSLAFRTAGINRWVMSADGTVEGGSNAGSDFTLLRRTDAGGPLGTALTINRATGQPTFESATPIFGGFTLTVPATGTAALGTGAADRVAIWTGENAVSYDEGLVWNNTAKRLGIGTPSPGYPLDVAGAVRINTGLTINGGVGTFRDVIWHTDGSLRWLLRCTNVAESGGNAGSDLQLWSRTDAGGALSANVMTWVRSTGAIGVNVTPTSQLHVVSGLASRVGLIVDMPTSPTANIAEFKAVGVTKTLFDKNGLLHTVGALGRWKMWEYDGVDGTARTVIPDGAGDVTNRLEIMYTVRDSSNNPSGGVTWTFPNSSVALMSSGGNTLTLSVSSAGAVTIQRTAGTLNYKVSLWLMWM